MLQKTEFILKNNILEFYIIHLSVYWKNANSMLIPDNDSSPVLDKLL